MAFPPAKKPNSLLGYHRILSPTAGVRVSPLCLGAMNFGEAWKAFLGECSKDTAFEMLDYFYEQGGNFIDTANNYQNEESETWIGEWMQKHGNRDEMVIATKFTTGFRPQDAPENVKANFQGNHAKSLHVSVKHSLKKLQTDYIDLLYVHWWDFTTSVPELMNSLNALVASGKVLYLGISDTPAWLVVKCNDYARFHGLTQFSVYQGHWSAAFRDFERDILPMVEAEGMGLAPWGALGRGMFKPAEQYNAADRDGRKMGAQDPKYERVAAKLETMAGKKGTAITSVALAYVMHKAPYVFPIVGGRKVEHLKGNIEALGVRLTQEEVDEIEDAEPFDVGFPLSFLFGYGGQKYRSRMTAQDLNLIKANTHLDAVPKTQHIVPRENEGPGSGQ
ncbi:Norsolorinic acid reductase A [Friedmanniomyces simplex]|uniref:Norsolorinic acid reductase A n=1 Tax=Friedmanniomyces simplex TaxID=329884 RepID=A0A4U0WTF6_9PEZI|nr:Norsolorinic acid reductase A [Friedmanniomyces simplex]